MAESFKPKPGQVDYTNAVRAPVVNCLARRGEAILIVRRGRTMRFYPGLWNGISGFLDDKKTPAEKAKEELLEEAGIAAGRIVHLKEGAPFEEVDAAYGKTWEVHPVLADVAGDEVSLDWEAEEYRWVMPLEALHFPSVPGFEKVVRQFFPI